MKIRTSFVSNSSSASFVINWKIKNSEDWKNEATELLALLFDVYSCYNEETGELKDEYDIFTDVIEVVKNLAKRTKKNEDGTFSTGAYTNMLNSVLDFPKEIMYLLMALETDEECRFEVISKRIENDGYWPLRG